ncbi:MAG: tetratricopeptide repeat protein [Candidatus Odinarchaeota archaeon]
MYQKKQEFKVNNYITLKLEKNETVIYIDGKKFRHCKRLIINIPKDKFTNFNDIDSIDEATSIYDHFLHHNKIYKEVNSKLELIQENPDITPEMEFLGHCSNLQVWDENDYDSRLLHSNLSFPLLKELFKAGDPKAKKLFKEEIAFRILSKYPPVLIYLFEEGYMNYLNNEEKVILLKELIKNDLDWVKNELLCTSLGKQFYEIKRYDKAIEFYRKAININPKYKFAWNCLGIVYKDLEQVNAALNCFKEATNIDPNNTAALNNIGIIYLLEKMTKKATEYFAKVIDIDPINTFAWSNLALIYMDLKSYNKARECYNRALDGDPKNSYLIYKKASLESILNNKTIAIELLKEAIKLDNSLKIVAKSDNKFNNIRNSNEFMELMI